MAGCSLSPASSPNDGYDGFHTAGKEGLWEQLHVRQADQQSVDFDALDPFLLKLISKRQTSSDCH